MDGLTKRIDDGMGTLDTTLETADFAHYPEAQVERALDRMLDDGAAPLIHGNDHGDEERGHAAPGSGHGCAAFVGAARD